MNWSSERLARGRVLSGGTVTAAPANLGVVSARSARSIVVSDELVAAAKQEGYAAGFEEGYATGYTQGMADAATHIQLLGQLVQRLGAEADLLAVREATARVDVEDQVVAAAFRIAEVIVGREIEQPDSRGRDAIARALALAPGRGHVTVHLHPADIAALGDPAGLDLGRSLEIVGDPSLQPGDCMLDIASCRVDARIGSALERVREVLS
jgi:flagellar assembly protein FliH